jgi:hypothetical protein
MRISIGYISFFAFIITLFVLLLFFSNNPEKQIEGEWKELSWEYEKVDKPKDSTTILSYKTSSDFVKQIVGENLIIHQAESWNFLPNGQLVLSNLKGKKIVQWRLKGRGNILEIKHNKDTVEHYNVTKLENGQLILNFDSDMHVRGIAKLTFERI